MAGLFPFYNIIFCYSGSMILGILSDTHDKLPTIALAIDFFKHQQVEKVVHCGDWKSIETLEYFAQLTDKASLPVMGVLGNNDVDVDGFQAAALNAPSEFVLTSDILEFDAGGKKCAVYHGHHRPTLTKVVADQTYDFIFLGHTHKPLITYADDKIIVNPGSTAFSIPRSKTWQPTVAIVDTNTGSATLHVL